MSAAVKVTAAATTANLGSGFDSAGIALKLYNTVTVSEWDELDICSELGAEIPAGERNLVYVAAKKVYELCGRKASGFRIREHSDIPMTRGLGSSSACIAAGLTAANELLGRPLPLQQMVSIACEIEGHPDNVAPALLGGAVISALDDSGAVQSCKCEVDETLQFAAVVPDFPLRTRDARECLPETVPFRDAVYNVSRAGLLAAALCTRRYELLRVACRDALHQPYRLPLIAGGEDFITAALERGALAAYVSGSGSTLMALGDSDGFCDRIEDYVCANEQTSNYRVLRLRADNTGTRAEMIQEGSD